MVDEDFHNSVKEGHGAIIDGDFVITYKPDRNEEECFCKDRNLNGGFAKPAGAKRQPW